MNELFNLSINEEIYVQKRKYNHKIGIMDSINYIVASISALYGELNKWYIGMDPRNHYQIYTLTSISYGWWYNKNTSTVAVSGQWVSFVYYLTPFVI